MASRLSPCPLLALAFALGLVLTSASTLHGAAAPAPGPVTATPLHKSGIYDLGEKAGWTLTATPGVPTPAGDFTYTVKTNNAAVIKTGTFSLASGSATIEVTQTEPAMLFVQVTPPAAAPAAPAGGGARAGGAGQFAPAAAPLPTIEALKTTLTLTDAQTATIQPLLDEVAKAQAAVTTAQGAFTQLNTSLGGKITPLLMEAQRPQLVQALTPAPRGGGGGARGGGGGLTLGAAIAPTKIQPGTPRPADFDAFWEGKLAELAKIPINPVLTPTPTNKEGVEFYTVMLDSVGSHVQGYLAKPAREGKFPAIIQYQYAGVYALSPASSQDRAAEGWLALNVDSHDIAPSAATGAPANYQSVGNTDRETSYFLKMYLRDARAVDYIKSRPDWDGKTIVFQGISMGGQQSLAAAGLRPNDVTAVLVLVPSGADIAGSLHGRTAGYPNWGTNDPKVAATAPYFDTINFASRIKAPVLLAMGFIDTIAPPVGNWTVLNLIPGAKEAVPLIDAAHNNQSTAQQLAPYENRAKEVRDLILHGGTFKPNAATSRP
jgi:cephalosporin-C deacetylase-like acetyl esterase